MPIDSLADAKFKNSLLKLKVIVIGLIEKSYLENIEKTLYKWIIADKSGRMDFILWDDLGSSLKPGDIITIDGAYSKNYNQELRLYFNSKDGKLQKESEFSILFSETFNHSIIED